MLCCVFFFGFFFFNDTATTEIYTLSLHDALPICRWDYAAGMFNEAITVNAPEQLADIDVPKRASYIDRKSTRLNSSH